MQIATVVAGFAGEMTLAAAISLSFLNNVLAYRDRRLRKGRPLRGWLLFVAACSVGAVGNVGIAGPHAWRPRAWHGRADLALRRAREPIGGSVAR